MSPESSTESNPAFSHIGLRENPGENLSQITCPDRESNPGHLVSRPDALAVTPQTKRGRIGKNRGRITGGRVEEKEDENAQNKIKKACEKKSKNGKERSEEKYKKTCERVVGKEKEVRRQVGRKEKNKDMKRRNMRVWTRNEEKVKIKMLEKNGHKRCKKNDPETGQEEKKKYAGSLLKKKLHTEGYTGRSGEREKSSRQKKTNPEEEEENKKEKQEEKNRVIRNKEERKKRKKIVKGNKES
ncbi:hypothetical protein ANN_08274 [Periplaneta americana]|uniref:Uncharacterized protein n=1 Tax=Periplaneta americana TaxID=6978 RepID=A0ABQ8T243_PERAM|nr:hypothetical protein ANN_08274 [Periplaneta americana]